MFLSRYPLPFYLSSLSIFFIYFFTFFLFTYFFFLVRFFASLAPFLKRTHKSEKSFFSFFLSSAETFLFLHRSIHLKHATYGRIYIYICTFRILNPSFRLCPAGPGHPSKAFGVVHYSWIIEAISFPLSFQLGSVQR